MTTRRKQTPSLRRTLAKKASPVQDEGVKKNHGNFIVSTLIAGAIVVLICIAGVFWPKDVQASEDAATTLTIVSDVAATPAPTTDTNDPEEPSVKNTCPECDCAAEPSEDTEKSRRNGWLQGWKDRYAEYAASKKASSKQEATEGNE